MGEQLLLVMAVALLFLAGCTVTAGAGDPARPLVVWATATAIQNDPEPAERAKRLIVYASAAKTFLDGQPVTLVQLNDAIRARTGLDRLSPADRLFGDELIRAVVGDLAVGVDQGAIDAQRVYRINAVLDWIIGAASAF